MCKIILPNVVQVNDENEIHIDNNNEYDSSTDFNLYDILDRSELIKIFNIKMDIEKLKQEVAIKERDLAIEKRDIVIEKRDIAIKERDIAIKERDVAIEKRDIAIKERDLMIIENKKLLKYIKTTLTSHRKK
ncbi:unnamed protein product [Rotaria sp. Silwood1]|nr:unnamed protein product [Rotaria sp. Silwood1]CAF5067434.1 unnamed protein product [Rotaria sp. Silwood1]